MSENPTREIDCPLRLATAQIEDESKMELPLPGTACVAERCAWWMNDGCAVKVIAQSLRD